MRGVFPLIVLLLMLCRIQLLLLLLLLIRIHCTPLHLAIFAALTQPHGAANCQSSFHRPSSSATAL